MRGIPIPPPPGATVTEAAAGVLKPGRFFGPCGGLPCVRRFSEGFLQAASLAVSVPPALRERGAALSCEHKEGGGGADFSNTMTPRNLRLGFLWSLQGQPSLSPSPSPCPASWEPVTESFL